MNRRPGGLTGFPSDWARGVFRSPGRRYCSTLEEVWNAMTAAEHERAALHARWGSGGNLFVSGQSRATAVSPKGRPVGAFRDEVAEAVCASDLVAIGTVETSKTMPVAAGDVFFTDYIVRVDEVVRSQSSLIVGGGQAILISRPGGAVRINGKVQFATLDSIPTLGVLPTKT